MTIIFRKDPFLYQIFPQLQGVKLADDVELERALRRVSSYSGYTPKIQISEDAITIDLNEQEAVQVKEQYLQIVRLAKKGQFENAKKILAPVLEKGTQNADLHRIYGQILEQEGQFEEATNHLIEALRWDPKNAEALLMIGNIYARHQRDVETAQLYYKKVIEIEPDNYLALNNIAGVLAQSGQINLALEYFEKAKTIEPRYPNTLYGIALSFYNQQNFQKAFRNALQALKAYHDWNEKNPALIQSVQDIMINAARRIQDEVPAAEFFSGLLSELEQKTGKTIKVIIDNSLPTAAKIEIAEYRNRDHHVIRYKKQALGVAHLVMHELIHLELIEEARALNENKLFTASEKNKSAFWKKAAQDKKKMLKAGLDEKRINGFLTSLFDGINLQIYNAPIDLFIEQRLYDRYEKLRPIQFISLLNLLQEAIAGANNITAKKISPKFVRDANITLTFTQLFQFKTLFGLDLTSQIREPILEKKARNIYQEYLRMKSDKEPGEEYDLIEWWAEDVKLKPYFNLIAETPAKARSPEKGNSTFELLDEFMAELEEDPYELNRDRTFQDEEMQKFVNAQRNSGLNMAVVMYMADALQYFSGMNKEKVQEVGFEIAHLGRFGINPEEKEAYSLGTVPGKTFTGWKLLAYMYISWSIFEPSMVKELQMDFADEYKLAQSLAGKD